MKNNYLILILSIIIVSCGNDDGSDNSNTIENLIGEWKITQRIINGNEDTLGACEPFNMYTSNEDGTYTELLYAAALNSDCLNNTSIEFTGTWQNNNNNTYSFTNSNNITSEFLIEFFSNNSFYKISTALSNPNDPVLATITEKYERIN